MCAGGHSGCSGRGRAPLPVIASRRGLGPVGRQSFHQCRRRAGVALRQYAGAGPRAGSRSAFRRDLARPARPAQGQHRLRPQATFHRCRRHARHHHGSHDEAFSAADCHGYCLGGGTVAKGGNQLADGAAGRIRSAADGLRTGIRSFTGAGVATHSRRCTTIGFEPMVCVGRTLLRRRQYRSASLARSLSRQRA